MKDNDQRGETPELPEPYPLDDAMEEGFAAGGLLLGGTSVEVATRRRAPAPAREAAIAEAPVPATPLTDDHEAIVESLAPKALIDQPPETIEQRLRGLQPWKAKFVLTLMDVAGVLPLAALRQRVSMKSVEEHLKADADFAKACAEAVGHSNGLLEGAIMRAATIGDLAPVHQGGELVGYKRVRSPKDAELALKLRGLMPEQQLNVSVTSRVELAREDEMAEKLREVALLLHAQPRQITGKVVSEREELDFPANLRKPPTP